MSMGEIFSGSDFYTALQTVKRDEHAVRELEDQNEQAAAIQEDKLDAELLELIMQPLMAEQSQTLDDIGRALDPSLYRSIATEHMRIEESLRNPPVEHQAKLAELEEKERKINESSQILLQRLEGDQLRNALDIIRARKEEVRSERASLNAGLQIDSDKLERLTNLFAAIRAPWPVPLIRSYANQNIGELVDQHRADVQEAIRPPGPEPEKPWEDCFEDEVRQAITALAEQQLLQENDVNRAVIVNKSARDTMGTDTALYKLHKSGLITRQRYDSKLMGPFEVVANHLMNTHINTLGKGKRQKRAAEIIHSCLGEFFAKQRDSSASE